MIVVPDTLPDGILLDVEQACADLRFATDACGTGDDALRRAQVQQCRDRLDALLDMWNEAGLDCGELRARTR